MREQPSMIELIQSVTDFLRDDAMPKLDGLTAFHTRVAVSLLEIVRRELELGPQADAAECAGLRALLGKEGDAGTLNRELCMRIADGSLSSDSPGLMQHLVARALDKLAVDQPGYSTCKRLKAVKPPGA